MELGFRSRGISFCSTEAGYSVRQKRYYDITDEVRHSHIGYEWMSKNVLTPFEYSLDLDDSVDAINYHVDLCSDCRCLYEQLPSEQYRILQLIPQLFDARFRNYTLGIRGGQCESGITYYYYPTFQKNCGYGIRGIVDKDEIALFSNRFLSHIGLTNDEEPAYIAFCGAIIKHKGIGITFFPVNHDDYETEYKLYGVMNSTDFVHLMNRHHISAQTYCEQFGEIVLSALRIRARRIIGYNMYFLR